MSLEINQPPKINDFDMSISLIKEMGGIYLDLFFDELFPYLIAIRSQVPDAPEKLTEFINTFKAT